MELALHGPKDKRFSAAVDGVDLVSTTTTAGKAKETRKTFRDAGEAAEEREKVLRKKLRDGWVHKNDAARLFDVCFVAYGGSGGAGGVLDLSKDGGRVVRVTTNSDLTTHAVDVVDLADGRITAVVAGATARQTFVHRALQDARGGVYYTLNDELWHVVIGDKRPRRVSGYFDDVNRHPLNPHVLRPAFDDARRRLMLFDKGNVVRVVDVEAGEETLCAIATGGPRGTVDCRAAALSPSGKLLALYLPSRGIVYSHDDAKDDATHVIDVYAVDGGALVHRVELPLEQRVGVGGLSFDAEDRGLVVVFGDGRGPIGLGFDGRERWRLGDETDHRSIAHAWAFSPDGSQLCVGRAQPALYLTSTQAPLPLAPVRCYRAQHVAYSANGRRLAVAADLVTMVFKTA